MKKGSNKTKKKVLATRTISSYFTKLPSNVISKTPAIIPKSFKPEEVIVVEDDNECQFVEKEDVRLLLPNKTILEPITNLPQCSTTPDQCPVTPERVKRKFCEGTPSPDFIPSSLESKTTKFIKRYTRPSSKKHNTKHSEAENVCSVDQNIDFELQRILLELKHQSPPKTTSPTKDKTKKIKTPRKSPRCLFNKSPKSLHKFNVEVLENFVRILPSSPSGIALEKVVKAQRSNENTPTKPPLSPQIISPTQHVAKVKTRLTFSPKVKDTANVQTMLNDSWENEWCDQSEALHLLDLEQMHRCKIDTVEKFCDKIKLVLTSLQDQTTGVCIVEGFWCNMQLEKDDIIAVSGVYDHSLAAWHVCNTYGLIVYKPDTLVSSTSVVGARFCLRRNVLNEHYRGFEPANRVMIIGVLVHKLFQEVLLKNTCDIIEIQSVVKNLMEERDTIYMLYESDLEKSDVHKEVESFIPRIVCFMTDYVLPLNGTRRKDVDIKGNWKGKIDAVQDIEENIWCSKLGLKGKVDVTVLSNGSTYPLELKTGKASASLEHRGQIMLYIMMMNQLGYKVPSGFLLYLREGVLREISMSHVERRDLILLRNELTYYIAKQPEPDKLIMELPEPINHHNACSSCPYNVICSTYLKKENFKLPENNPLNILQETILSHLEPQHMDYFIKWSSLIRLEGTCGDGHKELKEIYTCAPEKREEKGKSIIHLKIKNVVEERGGLFNHTFEKINSDKLANLQTSGLNIGDYVIVSTNARPAVSSGLLTHIDYSDVSVNLDRNLQKRYPKSTFHLDTYNSSISQTFNMANLGLLLEANEQAAKLRKIIIDKTPPTFVSTLPKAVATKGVHILRTLNKNQQKAVLKALRSNDYLLIKGMPGTGKTATIVSLIQILVQLNKTVLITSHTHSAVDNVCIRLQNCGINLLRLGSDSKINPKLLNCSEKTLTRNCKTVGELDQVYKSAQVVAVTCLGSGHTVLSKRTFDVAIIDESTQILQCSVIRALYSSNKFILIGDPDQLPPIVRSREALTGGLSESLFERLDMPSATVTLIYNYRMNKPITDMANSLTYNGELLIANDEVANAVIHIPDLQNLNVIYANEPWILKAIDPTLSSAVKVLDTGPVWMHLQASVLENNLEAIKCSNRFETAIIVKLIEALLKGGISTSDMGVIAPYRAQVASISSALEHKNVEVSTVDQFQGRDKEIVIYSCTKSAQHLSLDIQHEILEDQRRLTVAITRAKHKFILIGDLLTVKRYSPFNKLLHCLDETCYISLKDDNDFGFSWSTILN